MNRDELQPGEQICSDDEVAAIRDELEEYCDEAEGLRMIRHPLITYTGYDGSKDTVMMLGRCNRSGEALRLTSREGAI